MVDGMAQEINARSEVLKMERQLDEARNKLTAIRQAKYKQRVAAGYGTDDSDFEGPPPHGFQTPSPTHLNRSNVQTPTSPSFHSHNQSIQSQSIQNQMSSTTYQEQNQQKRSNLLSGNAVPKPYNSSMLSSATPSPQPISPAHNRIYETTTIQNPNLNAPNLNAKFDKSKLEACVQDLHEKTFGKNSPTSNVSSFKSSSVTRNDGGANGANGGEKAQNYEGYTTR